MKKVIIVGAGLAGSEAAWQAAKAGTEVTLYEMRSLLLPTRPQVLQNLSAATPCGGRAWKMLWAFLKKKCVAWAPL